MVLISVLCRENLSIRTRIINGVTNAVRYPSRAFSFVRYIVKIFILQKVSDAVHEFIVLYLLC